MSQWDDNEGQDPQNPYEAPAPAAARLTGPITDPNDPRLTDPSYASDPFVLDYINKDLAAKQVAAGNAGTKNSPEWQKYIDAANQKPAPVTETNPTTTTPIVPPAAPIGTAGSLVPPDGTYPGGAPPQYGGGPTLNLPDYKNYQPPEYDFQKFAPTTAADMLTDPGYQVRFDRGLDAVRADKAASGVLNGGGTARALLDYGQDSASQEFKNVDDRRLTDFNVNEGNRFKSYLSNVNTQYDTPYMNAYKSAFDTGNFAQGNQQFTQNSNYSNWLSSYNSWRNSRNDAFDQKFKVSSF